MIADHVIEEVRTRADIVDVVGEQVPLKRAGKDFRALCPFHTEKTPSFYVVPTRGFYKCFGCGESGDVFTFLMKRNGLSFQEAVRELGGRYGVEVPDPRLDTDREEPHRALYEALAFADDFFQRNLADETAGARARGYLEQRGIGQEAIERFGIGYAPDGWRVLREEAHRHGIVDDVLLAAGLIKESDRGDDPYDRFRDRITFPIRELGGRTVAFGGRILARTSNAPKYLNSPETPVYHKGDLLYGLNWSRGAIRRQGSAVVVEGYMDYVSLAARGIENVVANLGTAMTEQQANLLARYTGKAYLLYDSDAAGLKATFRSADALLHTGVQPLVVTLPAGEDPDSLVTKGGGAALKPFLDAAMDVIERKIQMLEERGLFADPGATRRALDRLLPTLRATVDPALRDIYTARIAQRTGVRRETLERDVERAPMPVFERRTPAEPAPAARPAQRHVPRQEWAAERLLLMVLLSDPVRREEARQLIEPSDLHDPRHREILRALLEQGEGSDPLKLSETASQLHEKLRATATVEILDAARSFESAVADIQLPELSLREKYLDDQLEKAPDEQKRELMQQKIEISQERKRLSERGRLGFKASRRYRELLGNRQSA